MIDICQQDMNDCGMGCPVFVPCAELEPLDDEMQLIIPGARMEVADEEEEDNDDEERKTGSLSPRDDFGSGSGSGSGSEAEAEFATGLRIHDTNCVVSNDVKECVRLVPLALARVSNDIDLKLLDFHPNDKRPHAHSQFPHIQGCVLLAYKPIDFAVHFYQYPHQANATLIEFQRRSGDVFVFQVLLLFI
ncbi:hypothetical protein RFI_33462, partial [Reticulomyxa filosa]